jgi:hypothetical protein
MIVFVKIKRIFAVIPASFGIGGESGIGVRTTIQGFD